MIEPRQPRSTSIGSWVDWEKPCPECGVLLERIDLRLMVCENPECDVDQVKHKMTPDPRALLRAALTGP